MPRLGVEADHIGRDIVTIEIGMLAVTLLRSEPEPHLAARRRHLGAMILHRMALWGIRMLQTLKRPLCFSISRVSLARAGVGSLHRSTSTRMLRSRPPIEGTRCVRLQYYELHPL